MIPKNRLREDVLKKRLLIYPGPFHPHFKQGLPQFTEQEKQDINEVYDFGKLVERRHNYKIVYESDPSDPPEEFADVERDIDPDFDTPLTMQQKTHTNPKSNIRLAKQLRSSWKSFAKYRKNRL